MGALTGNAALNMILDEIVEAVAERVAEKLGQRPAGAVVYTTHKGGPHIPTKTRRWMLDHVKGMPGARKIGRDWEISATDYESWVTAEDSRRCRDVSAPRRPLVATKLVASSDDAEFVRRAQRALEASGFRRTR